jgi:hypothetical protein
VKTRLATEGAEALSGTPEIYAADIAAKKRNMAAGEKARFEGRVTQDCHFIRSPRESGSSAGFPLRGIAESVAGLR